MAEEGRGVALAILGVVAVIAVVGLVLLFAGRTTGKVSAPFAKTYTRSSTSPEEFPYPYLTDRTAGGFPLAGRAGVRGYPDGDGYAKQQDIPSFGTTVAQGRESYQRQPEHIPSVQTCAVGTGESGEIPCPVYKQMQSICLSKYGEAEARAFTGWQEVPGSPGCYVPPSA